MELKTIAECDKELDYLDKMHGSLKWFLEHAEGQLKYYQHMVEEYNRQMLENNVEWAKVDQRKKELCDTIKTDTHLNKESCSQSTGASAVIEDYARLENTHAIVAKTLND